MERYLRALQASFGLINKFPSILLVALVFSVLNTGASSLFGQFKLVQILVSVLMLGWFGAQFVYLQQAYEDHKVVWRQIAKRLGYYVRILLVPLLALVVLALVPVGLLVLWFSKWFVSSLSGAELLSRQELVNQIVFGLLNREVWQAFAQHNLLASVIRQVFLLSSLVGGFVASMTMSVVVVQKFGVWRSIREGLKFVSGDLYMLVVYLVFRIGFNVLIEVLSRLAGGLVGELGLVIIILGRVYAQLILDGFVLIYFLQNVGKLRRVGARRRKD